MKEGVSAVESKGERGETYLRDSRSSFPRDFVAAGNVDDIDDLWRDQGQQG